MAKNTKKAPRVKSSKSKIPGSLSQKRTRIILFTLLFGIMGAAYLLKTNALCACGSSGSLSLPRSKIIYIANAQRGQTEFNSAVLKYTDGNREAWCADYVSWVYKTAGYPFAGGLSGGWRWPVASETYGYSLRNYVTYIGKFKARGSYTPIPGDIIFFNPSTFTSHVGIVLSVGDGKVYTVEGNIGNIRTGVSHNVANGGKVDNRSYSLTDTKILGYGDMF